MAKKSGSNLFRKWSGKRTRRPLSLTLVMLMALGVAGTAWAADEETGRTYAMIMTESDVTLNDYKGKDVYFWKHDISNPSQLQGGFVTVIKAGKQKSGDNARITLVTDHSGLDLANETAVKAILKSLADKLTYSAYIEGEKNLDGSVSIYEGLTFASASMKTSALDFNETTGKAVITEVKTPFTAVLGEDDKEYKERNILQADGTYKFTEDTIIHPDFNITKEDNYARDFASIYATEDTNIDMTGHDLAINMHGNIYNGGGFTSRACGIYVPGKGTITVDHPGAIDIDLDATYYYYGGIGVMTKDSHVIINNDVDPAHRVKIRATTPFSGFEMNVTGLKTFSGTIDIAGLVDIYTDRAWGTNAAGGRISVGGGTIHTDNYDAVTARSGGIMNMNIQGTAETGLTPGENDVTIVGNLGSMGAWVGADENAEVNVALMNEHSSLTGRAHEVENTPDEGKVGIRLFLQNGSKWYNTGASSLRQLYGGRDAGHAGFIDMTESGGNDLVLARLSGHTVVYYPHDISDPTVLRAGNIRIGRAYLTDGQKATLYVRTDRTGINDAHLEDKNYVNQILYELAQKLNYVAYNNGERNLQGWAQLAEGMTAPGAVKKAEILFKDGIGYIAEYMQEKTDFTTTLTGDKTTDEEYVAAKVLREENRPSFMIDSTIRLQDANGIEAKSGAELQVDLKNTTLHIDVNGVGKPTSGIYVKGTAAQINSNKGKLNLTGKGTAVGISVKSDTAFQGNLSVSGDTVLSISGVKTGIELLGTENKDAVMNTDNYSNPLTIRNSNLNDASFVGIKTDKGILNVGGSLIIDSGKGVAIEGSVKAYGANIKSAGGVALKPKRLGHAYLYAGSPKSSDKTGRDVVINAGEGNLAIDGTEGSFGIGSSGWDGWIGQNPGKVCITGDILTGKPGHSSGEIAIQGKESYWKGGLGEADKGGLFLKMADGAHWYNMTSGNAVRPAMIGQLTVSNNHHVQDMAPCIHQNSDKDIEIKILQQDETDELNILYKHDPAAPGSILGGKFIVDELSTIMTKCPLIRLVTDSDYIDMQNADQVAQVLDALAHKLIYKEQGTNKGIIGKVRISESLTNPDQSLKDDVISFRWVEEQGYLQGFYTAPAPGANVFTVPLTTEAETDRLYTEKGIRISEQLYAFRENTTIETDIPVNIMKQGTAPLILEGENHTLNLKGKSTGIRIEGKTIQVPNPDYDPTDEEYGSPYFEVYPNLVLVSRKLKEINIAVDGTLPESRGIYVKDTVLQLRRYLSHQGGSDGKNTVISITGNTTSENGKDFAGLEVDGVDACCISELPLHIVALGGTALLDKKAQMLHLSNENNIFRAPEGNLLKVQDVPSVDVQLTGTDLVGDVDLREAGTDVQGTVGVALSGDGGTWTGGFLFENQDDLETFVFLYDGFGTGNVPTWVNQFQHPQLEADEHLNMLEGTAGGPYVGTVVQKSNHALLIDTLSRNVRFCFDHNAQDPAQIIGGDVKITSGNGRVYLRTDNAGIDTKDTTLVTKVLNALAHKLYYLNYTTGEQTMTGAAEIAEALTSPSVLKQGEIAFDETTGQGYFGGTPQTPSQTYTKFITPITGEESNDPEYVNNGVRNKGYYGYYMFHADSLIVPQKNLDVPYRAAIDAKQGVYVGLNSHSLNLNMENGSLDPWDVGGIWVEGKTYSENNIAFIHKGKEINISVTNDNGKAVGIVARDEGEVAIEGITNIQAPIGIEARGGTVALTAGTIQAETLADIGENGVLTIDSSDTTPAVLSGQWKQDGGEGRLSLGKGSVWTGDSWLGDGQLEVHLQDGGRWNLTEESKVSLLRGGVLNTLGGIVDQRQLGALMQEHEEDRYLYVDRFSGCLTFFYGHDKKDLSKVIGGMVRVNKAEAGSQITLLTDREGLSEADLLEKEKVEPLLDALAQKLYYTSYKEENNLQGIVKIGEGLTGQSVAKVTGDIYYTGEDGQGRYKAGSAEPALYPGSQQVTEFHTPITGRVEQDTEYLEAGVLKIADPANLHYDFTKDKTAIVIETAADGAVIAGEKDFDIIMYDHLLSLKNKGDNGIHVTNSKQIFLRNSSHVTVEAQKTGIKTEGENSKFRTVNGGMFNIYAPIAFEAQDGSEISVGTGTVAADVLARVENGGMINLFTPDDKVKMELSGDIIVRGKKGKVCLGVASKGSTWTGGVQNEGGTVELGLLNGGVWNNTGKTEARLTSLDARSDSPLLGDGAICQLEDSGKLTVSFFMGKLTLLYAHEAANPKQISGGAFTVEKASPGSEIVLRTDRSGLALASEKAADKNLVSETLNALANKLYYTAYKDGERNLQGQVEIAEGLTAQSASKRLESLSFRTEDGQGQYLYTPAVEDDPNPNPNPNPDPNPNPPIIYGDKETVMMRGSKSAMTAATLLWRGNNNDLQRRMGDVRLGKEDSGIWARYLGGKNELDQPKTTFKQTYNLAQVGYDKKVGDWMLGIALDYGTGNDTYASGTGKEKLASLALYGTRQSKDGQYLDLIVRGSQLKNDYTVYNEMGHKLDGNYKTWGMSFSAEYGKRFVKGNGFYIDPSIELTAGHLNGKDYDAVSDYTGNKKMHVQQDGVNSVIGRLGLGMGYETATSNLFAKVALAHEFGGKLRSTFSAVGEPTGSTEVDLKDTWIDLEVGGSWQVNKDTYLYGTYTRNFGADLSNKWRVDAGVRWSF